MKTRYIFLICLLIISISCVSAQTFMPDSGIFAFKEVENVTINDINFTIPTEYKQTFLNSTEMHFKHGKDKLKISVVKDGKIKKVKSSKKVKSGKTMLGSVNGYLVDKNSSSYAFSYHEGKKLVVINSNDISLIMGVMGKD